MYTFQAFTPPFGVPQITAPFEHPLGSQSLYQERCQSPTIQHGGKPRTELSYREWFLSCASLLSSLSTSFATFRHLKEFRQPLGHYIHIHINQRHLLIAIFLHNRHQGQIPIHLTQHDGP